MLHHIVWYMLTGVAEDLTASIIRVGACLLDYAVQHPRMQASWSYTLKYRPVNIVE